MGMRQPHPELELYIAGKASVPACGGDVDDIIDCTPEGCRSHGHQAKVLHLPPTGGNDHQWEMTDLDDIVELAIGCLEKGRIVLIHCNRGVSRSTTAACAVLLALGKARNVPEAIEMAVERGVGIAFVSEMVAARGLAFGRVKKVELQGLDLHRTVYISRNVHYPFTRAQSLFWDFAQTQREKLNTEIWDSLVNFSASA